MRLVGRLLRQGDRTPIRGAVFLAGLVVCLASVVPASRAADDASVAPPAPPFSNGSATRAELQVPIIYLGKKYDEPQPLSLVEKPLSDQGIQGARVALDEDNKTGRLIGQSYQLEEKILDAGSKVAEAARAILVSGSKIIIADLEAADLIDVADLTEAADALIIDVRTSDDELRGKLCRANVLHVRPSTSMRTDALAQYLAWKRWYKWLLVTGKKPKDLAYAAALRRSAKRFGAKIVDERSYSFEAGSRRTDTGHQQIQTQMPMLTQGAAPHDVVMIADEEETFGEYVLFRTTEPRPVAGTHGLVATAWHRSFEEYAATQMQNRFERRTGRIMTERDYAAWLAVRIVGEAVTRTGKNGAQDLRNYILSDAFEVAGFKGEGMNFRKWDLQLRQPMLIAGPRAMISISPQEGFLHEHYLTDTLGVDAKETQCRLKAAGVPGGSR